MSNSSLVNYTKISQHKNSPRNHAIDTITIHCYVGQASVESAGSWFSNPSAKCSCNYMIGTDGRIALIVDEKDRSWCSSSSSNDNRAVTIECASDSKEPYAVNAKVYASLINLVADICKRNGIKALKWKADKSLIGQVDKQNMTVHRWFANKSCPGNYLYNLHGQIAAEVNKKLGAASDPAPAPSSTDAEKTIWNFLKGKGLNDFAVAGIMGNLFAESALKPNNLQNTFEKKLGMSDAEYTAAVDNGSYKNFSSDSAGYGLAQWTFSTRKKALYDFAKSAKKSIADLNMQLDFFWKEIQGYSGVMNTLKSAASVLAASNAVLTGYEKPADQGSAVQKKRAEYGQGYYNKFAGKNPATPSTPAAGKNTNFPAVPFSVTVKVSDLNYRASGSNSGAIKGQTGKGVFTITEVKNGWGKLKSGAGWIYLENADYVTIGKTVSASTGSPASFKPYEVRVTAKDLRIRAGAGTDKKIAGICPPGVYTIVEEASGAGATKWGKLKSGAGWISLDYAKKV